MKKETKTYQNGTKKLSKTDGCERKKKNIRRTHEIALLKILLELHPIEAVEHINNIRVSGLKK